MKSLLTITAVLAAAGLTLASGWIHGRLSNRWGSSEDLLALGSRLEAVPKRFADWELQSSEKMDPVADKLLQCAGSIIRVYRNQKTNDVVHMALFVGPHGPIAVHTPEVCYSSRAYQMLGERQHVAVSRDDRPLGEFWAVSFQANTVNAEMLRVYYGWNGGQGWTAPREPRFTYSGAPFLYKIQLAAHLPAKADVQTHDPCAKFLEDFLPAAQPHLGVLGKP